MAAEGDDGNALGFAARVLHFDLSTLLGDDCSGLLEKLATIDGSDGTGKLLTLGDAEHKGGYTIIGYGAQDATLWGIKINALIADPNPPVYQSDNSDNSRWNMTFSCFGQFAATYLLWKSALIGDGVRGVILDGVPLLADRLRLAGLGCCEFSRQAGFETFFDGRSYLVCVGHGSLVAVAQDEKAWMELEDLTDCDWDYCSLDDE